MDRIPHVKAYDIVGYTHSDGYCLCPEHALVRLTGKAQVEFLREKAEREANGLPPVEIIDTRKRKTGSSPWYAEKEGTPPTEHPMYTEHSYILMRDKGNESGEVQPIFAGSETDNDLVCDVCLSKAIKHGTDPRDAIILEANIDTEDEDDEETCCVCGKPAEGEDVCACVCPRCGENVFDDQTLTDHGMCYSCFQNRGGTRTFQFDVLTSEQVPLLMEIRQRFALEHAGSEEHKGGTTTFNYAAPATVAQDFWDWLNEQSQVTFLEEEED